MIAWNYRSYARSDGTPDPFSSYHDSESVLRFLIKDLGVKGKIGVFGRSLGGVMATYLAHNYPSIIDFLFVDRSFGNLQAISENMVAGSKTNFLLDSLSNKWVVESDRHFYEAKCFKILAQDPNDEMVNQFASLSSNVSRLACNDFIGTTRYASLKIDKVFEAMKMLYVLDSKLNIQIKNQSKI